MLTPEQLTDIAKRLPQALSFSDCSIQAEEDVATLLAELTHLQTALTAKDHVLSQFANSENWTQYNGIWEWRSRGCPYSLANQVLEGKE